MNRDERFEFTYINSMGKKKTEQARSKERLNNCLQTCKDLGYEVVGWRKLYPFSTMKHQHNFFLIYNICFNAMNDMEAGDTPWDSDGYNKLVARRDKAGEYMSMPLPIVWVPYDVYRDMKEMATAAICHRDAACARARADRYERSYQQ